MTEEQLVPVISPDGVPGHIPASQLEDAVRQGFQETDERYVRQTELAEKHKGLGQIGLTALEGAASGATFGLSDLAAAKIGGEETRQAMAERAELNPSLRTASEVGGAIAPMLLSGGSGALARAAEFAPTSIVGKLGAGAARLGERAVGEGATSLLGRVAQSAVPLAAQGATEGAFYGAGQVISENALGGQDITAEKLLAGAEHGAITGFLGGGAIGAVGAAGKYAAEKAAFKFAGEGSLKTWLQDLADNQTVKALGGTQRDIGRLGRGAEATEERISSIADTVRKAKLDDGTKVFKPFSNASDMAEKLVAAEEQAGARLAKVTDKIEGIVQAHPETAPDLGGFLKQVDTKVLADLNASAIPAVRNRALAVEDVLTDMRAKVAAGEEVGFKELRKIRTDLDSVIYQERANAASGIPNLPNPKLQALEKTRGILEDTIEKSADRAAELAGDKTLNGAYQVAKQEFRDLRQAKEMAERWQMRDIGNRTMSPSDYATGIGSALGAISGGVGGLASMGLGMAATAGHNFIRERGSSVIAHLADQAANIGALSKAASQVDSKIASAVGAFIKGEAPRALVQTNGPSIAESSGAARRKAYENVATKLGELNSNPAMATEKMVQHVAPLATHAPGLATATSTALAADIQYLQSKMPPQHEGPSVQPQFSKPRVSDADIAKFGKILRALDKPLSVLDDMARNKLSRDAVEAVKARRPELFQQMQAEVVKQVSDAKSKLPYDKRVQLGILFDVPTDRTMTPEFMRAVKDAFANHGAQPEGPGPAQGGAHVPDGMKFGGSTMTQTQRLEAR